MNSKKPNIVIVLLLLLVLIGLPIWLVIREMRQARLDNALIAAIKEGNNPKILQLLTEGASGEARENEKPLTCREALLHLLDHFRHPGTDEHEPALLLLYRMAFDSKQLNYSLTPGPDLMIILPLLDHGPGPELLVVRSLLDHGAQVNDRDAVNRSPLLYASGFSNGDAIRLLIARGAETEAKDKLGLTPLIYADPGVTTILVEHGANIEARSWDNRTPLIWAVIRGNPDVVNTLLEHGAKVSPKDKFGKTVLDYVRDKSNPAARKIAALLRQYGAK